MPNRSPGNARSPRIQAPHHEGGRPKAEELLREAHRLLDGAGIVMSHTKVARACRDFARRPHGSFRDFLSEVVRAEQGSVAGLMAAAVPRHRAIREWDALGTREGSWPVASGGARDV